MQLGIFARTFKRPTVGAVLDAIQGYGLDSVQFNMECVGLPSLPDEIDPALALEVRKAFDDRNLLMVAVSGTYNMIHPDPEIREHGLERIAVLAAACQQMGTAVITLCTGTRDPYDKWRYHAANGTAAAWQDLTASMESALAIAHRHQITLAIEPEPANVVDSALKARRLLDEFGTPQLKVIIDPANLVQTRPTLEQHTILDEAFDLLGNDLVLAHAKDLCHNGQPSFCAAGTGVVDYDYYLAWLRKIGFNGPLLLHGLTELQVGQSLRYLSDLLDEREKPTLTAA